MKKLQIGLAMIIAAATMLTITSCDDKMKNLMNTKWTLDKITTSYGQDLYPNEFYTVMINEGQLNVSLDVNKCRIPYSVVGKNMIEITETASCTRMCCDSEMAEALKQYLIGKFEVIVEEDNLTLKGNETLVFHKWTEKDVKREKNEDYIKIKRTGCFGTCPIYEMTLFPDGSALYTGKRFVEVTGKQSHEFDQARIARLFKQADIIDFTSLQPLYDDPSISDMESIYIEHNGTTIKVRYKVDVPKSLLELIGLVHQCSIDAGWVAE